VGASYGGYSALISVVRSPERYRCAASLNGPTDLAYDYQFYLKLFEDGRDFFQQYVGDPDDLDQLRSISPAYNASKIAVPVMLVQGTEDRRVDVDHYYRMLNVLEELDKPHEAYLMRGAGHTPNRDHMVRFMVRLRGFLERQLQPAAPVGD
jgi:dipeptidyl aminopeptidase/acylaminoacyl peptidase